MSVKRQLVSCRASLIGVDEQSCALPLSEKCLAGSTGWAARPSRLSRHRSGQVMTARVREIAPVTLVLAVLNAEADLPDLLTSIGRQSLLPAELLIANLGSTDRTRQLLDSWHAPGEMTVKLLETPGASTSEGRNVAIESASFEHIAVIHGAVCLHHEWLAQLWSALSEGTEAAAGLIQPVGSSMMERVIGRVEMPPAEEVGPTSLLPSSTSLAFSKSIWDRVGGYPEWLRYGQDKAFDRAVREAGGVFRFVPSARSSWNPRQSLRAYVIDNFDTSRAEGRAGMDNGVVMRLLSAYLGGALTVVVFRRSRVVRVAACVALLGHVQPLLRRVWRTRQNSPDRLAPRLLATFAVVVVSDAAKAAGYLVGRVTALWTDQAFARLG